MRTFKVAETQQIPTGKTKLVKLAGKQVLIANVNGTYHAIGNECTHMGGQLSASKLEGTVVTCPWHTAKFDVTTGKVVAQPPMLMGHGNISDAPVYKVKVEGKDIIIETE
jgi:3-phenylpropionate/trans-cinnamate dioxygenase ferredoxin component